MPYGKCGEARAGMSRRSGGVESRNSSDLHRGHGFPPVQVYRSSSNRTEFRGSTTCAFSRANPHPPNGREAAMLPARSSRSGRECPASSPATGWWAVRLDA